MLSRQGCAILLGVLFAAQAAFAQGPSNKPPATSVRTILEAELLTSPDGGALQAQNWRAVFEQLDVAVTIHKAVLDEKPEVKERVVGTLRYVTVVGRLDRQGRIVFPDRVYSQSDVARLKEWFDELKTYGRQGAPEGQPLWGLSKQQFDLLYTALSEVSDAKLQGLPLDRAAIELSLPAQYPLRWSTAATDRLKALGDQATVRQEVAGFTKATSLAIALNDRGFGFRPNRTPSGSLELVIEPLARDKNELWPIGWPPQRQVPEMLPGLFAMTNIELRQEPLLDVLDAAADLAQARILLDYAALDQRQVKLDEIKVSLPLKKTTWSLVLRAVLVPQKLNREYWQDEAGRAFVWIVPIGKERTSAPPPAMP